jgi:tetratricopeptide (TPR) repeat protein
VRTVPSDAEARSYLAHSYLECGRLDEAKAAIASHPDAWTRIEIQARIEMAENRPVRAVELLRPIAVRSGGASLLTRAIAQTADAALSRGDVAGAQRYWNEWLRIEPKADVPRALLAATSAPAPPPPVVVTVPIESAPAAPMPRAAGETRPATALATTRAATTPVTPPRQETTAPQPRLTLRDAAASLRDGDNIRAEAAARQVLAARQENVEALNLLGIALERQGRRAAAIEAFERSLAVNPNQAAVREAMQELKRP